MVSHRMRQQVYDKYGGVCAYCGRELSLNRDRHANMASDKMHVDHIHPRSRGGSSDLDNLNPSCFRCNWWKADMDLEAFRDLMLFQREGVPVFSGPQREWLKQHYIDIDRVLTRDRGPYVFAFERNRTDDRTAAD